MKAPQHDRWASHLRNCSKCPGPVRASFNQKTTIIVQAPVLARELPPADLSVTAPKPDRYVSEANGRAQESKRPRYETWLDRLDQGVADVLDRQFANIFFETGIPFRVADTPAVRTFLNTLRPAWTAPSAKTVATTMLDDAHRMQSFELDALITSSPEIVLLTDGWSNVKNDHLVNFVISFTNDTAPPMLYKTISTGEDSQTGSAIALAIGDVIDAIGTLKVVGVVTDNAPNMQSA